MAALMDVASCLFHAYRAYQLYTFRSPDCRKALENVSAAVTSRRAPVVLEVRGDRIREDRMPLSGDEVALVARLLAKHELPGIQFFPGVGFKQVAELLVLLDTHPLKLKPQGGLKGMLEQGLVSNVTLPGANAPVPASGAAAPEMTELAPLAPPQPLAPPPMAKPREPEPIPHVEPEHFLEASWEDQPTGIFVDFFQQAFAGSHLELFFRSMERLLLLLSSSDTAERAKGLSGFKAMGASLAEGTVPLLPTGILPYLADRLLDASERETHAPLQEGFLDVFSALFSGLAVQGDQASAADLLGRMDGRNPDLHRLLARRSATFQPLVACLHREGRTALEDKVVPACHLLGPEANTQAVKQLGDEPMRTNRLHLLELLKALGPYALPALRAHLGVGPWYLTRNLTLLMGELRDPALYEELKPLASHADPRVRRAAAHALILSDYARAEVEVPTLYAQAELTLQQEIQNLLARLAPVS